MEFETKFKLSKLIIDEANNNNAYAVQIYAGPYIFWIKTETYVKGIEEGLIDIEQRDGYFTLYALEEVLKKGETAIQRLNEARENSSIGYLKEALLVVNEMPDILYMDYTIYPLPIASIQMMVRSQTIEVNFKRKNDKQINREMTKLNSAISKGYSGVLNFIANHLDMEYMNTGNLVRLARKPRLGKTVRPLVFSLSLQY